MQILALCGMLLLAAAAYLRESVVRGAQSFATWAWRRPMHTLYMHAPAFMQFGGWAGATLSDICASLTGMPSDFWAMHQRDCEILVHGRFESFRHTLEAAAHILAVVWISLTAVAGCVSQSGGVVARYVGRRLSIVSHALRA